MEGKGIVKVTAFRVKHSSSWEALDVSIPTAFSEQNRRPPMPDRASVGAGFPDGWFPLLALPRACTNSKWEMWGLFSHHYNSSSPGSSALTASPFASLFLEHPALASIP